MENLVNSVKCAELVSNELKRSVKREYISRLASESKIPYHLVDGKKMYYPSEVISNLPMPRITSYINDDLKRVYIDQLNIIEHFQSQGVGISFDRKRRTKKSYQNDEEFNTMLPLMNIPTIDEVKKELEKQDLTKEEKQILTDELIEKEIFVYEDIYLTLSNIWFSIHSSRQEFENNLNVDCNKLDDNQKLMIFYILLEQFPKANYIADGILDTVVFKMR